ncbi:DNA ligase (ATP) [Apophysomyces sp. BC1015]|nr:DNA ligase (ATP) [Apophysomyces sp. BC1015]
MYSSTKTPLFGNFCALLQSISDQRGTQEKKKRLAKYIYDWRFNYGDDFYEAMRLLLPHLDRSRYGIKETMLAKAYTDALRLGKTSTDAYNLLKWKLPSTSKYTKSSGDFAAVAFEAISSRSTITTSTQSIHDVNVLLDDMSRSKSEEKRKHDLFKHIVEQYTPFEQKWMIRIILKDLKIGMSENSVFDVYHPQARELFSVCSNLEKVCKDLRDPHTSIAKSTIQLFEPFKPQLGHKEVPKDVRKVLFDGHFYIEDKIDGERIQMHFEKSTGKFRWFSRKSTDYTHLYGDSPQSSKLTGIIADCFEAESLILDGEMIGYDPKLDVFLPFGSLKTTAKDETLDPHKSRPCFIVFDMVYCNGFQMSKYTLADRLKVLNSVVKEKRGYLNLLPREEKSTFQDIVHALDRAISLRKEGLVIKNPGSTYEPGARNPTWIKLKPEYIDSLHDNCDLIVIGAKYGTGRRGNRLAQFLCALRDDRIPDNENPKFLTFTMLGTGYTVDELDEFGKILENLQPYNAKNQPSWLVHPEKSDEVPDVIVHYAKSVVVEVKATEIVWGNMFGSGSTLRFPRFMRFRKDKSWSDIMTYSEMVAAKRSGTIGGQVRASASQHDFLANGYTDVVTGGNGHTKNGLEEKIQENGGTFVQTEITAQYWIIDCDEKQDMVPLAPKYMLFATNKSEQLFRVKMDQWGDMYTQDTTEQTLGEVLSQIKVDISDVQKMRDLCEEIQERYFKEPLPGMIFQRVNAYLDLPTSDDDMNQLCYLKLRDKLWLVSMQIQFYGGTVVDDIKPGITHVVMDKERLEKLLPLTRSFLG